MACDTLEEKLRSLAECGFQLKDPFDVSDLVDSWGCDAFDEPGFDLTLVCLGMTEERPPWTSHCENLWHFDTECIEGDGSYVCIAKRMAEMARGSLPLSDFDDHVDVEEGVAWLQFACDEAPIRIDCAVDDDRVLIPTFLKRSLTCSLGTIQTNSLSTIVWKARIASSAARRTNSLRSSTSSSRQCSR